MTTTVKVHVNGQYRAFVTQDGRDPVTVEGNYNGGSGEHHFHLAHPADSTFRITEQFVTDEDKKPADPAHMRHETIGWAVKQMHNGAKVRRAGWNGKGMWLKIQYPDHHSKMSLPYVYMSTADGKLVPWLCSQTDLLASDWEIAE
jgi:Protein of unknown function (DUF2829)